MGVQVGSRLRNGNSHRPPDSRDLHRREVASERHWRIRHGILPVSGIAHAANEPAAATPSTPPNPSPVVSGGLASLRRRCRFGTPDSAYGLDGEEDADL
jgi:hypothetical protein